MGGTEGLPADAYLDGDVPVEDQQLLVDTLADLGVAVDARVLPPRRSEVELTWLVLIALPLQAFLSTVGTKVSEDAYRKLKGMVARLVGRQSRSAGARPVVLEDAATGLKIMLDPGLPDDGYRQLLELDLSQFRLGPVHYDRHERRWRSIPDEARSPEGHDRAG